MKVSNITYSSNIYVFKEYNKIGDADFMARVIDPCAIRELAEHNRGINGTTGLNGIQQVIYKNSMPCSLGNGDYTHGTILENDKLVCVNRCEYTPCPEYRRCSSLSDFRTTERPIDKQEKSIDNGSQDPGSKSDELSFVFEDENLKVPKLIKIKKIKKTVTVTEVEEVVERNYNDIVWSVRPHIRHLPDGTTTWVKGHFRGHNADTSTYYRVRTITKFITPKYKFSPKEKIYRVFEQRRQRFAPVDAPQTYQLKNIKYIESAERIIESDIKSRILVNAGPGTGKTHTVIERLKFLAKHEELIAPESVFVLCFSRSAVKVINDRLDVAIKANEIPLSARLFNIATFDSFATWFLRESNPSYDLSSLDYDARIERFISEFNKKPNDLQQAIEYLIVDEVQDLVGVRALLVKTLLEHMLHGFLLLGDECQAIYDYQIKNQDELNATKLYEWLENYYGKNLSEYELTRNHRNTGSIDENLKNLRTAMLFRPIDEQQDAINELFNRYGLNDMNLNCILDCCVKTDETQALLSWSNGDAYRMNSYLYSIDNKPFTHKILTGARHLSYRREIADILSGYNSPIISHHRFSELAKSKEIDDEIAEKIWAGFAILLDYDELEEVELKTLNNYLISERRVVDDLLCPETATLTISTIHKAKGKEYDTVLLNYSGVPSNGEDIKVYYVAMTRAKKDLIIKKNTTRHRDRSMESGRHVEIKQGNIKRVELGLDGDIDPISFIAGDNAIERQEYIASNIKQGDPIKISKQGGKYYIVHNGHYIGEVRSDIFVDWDHKESYEWKSRTYNLSGFTDFDDLFVSDIVTIVNIKLDARISDEYKKCGFWYGIEFCGYAKPLEE